ncbi:hypothetical protein CPB86DRAFT_452310 [Serendipita vermifera]|nr:hypothetical protein CPB86DRAFT_452310 [Serendipita vermifera]
MNVDNESGSNQGTSSPGEVGDVHVHEDSNGQGPKPSSYAETFEETDCCVSCHQPWNIVSRARRRYKTTAGPKGSFLPRCEACYSIQIEVFSGRAYNGGRKKPDPPALPSKILSFKAFEDEMRPLGQHKNWTRFSAAINDIWDGDGERIRAISSQIIALVHQHTGYKFISTRLKNTYSNLISTVVLHCTQRDSDKKAAQRLHSDILQAKSEIRMERFPCGGTGKIMFYHQSRHVALHLAHLVSHPSYIGTSIPTQWAKYIMERQDWNPSKVRSVILLRCEVPI